MSALQLFDALPSHIEDALRASIRRFGVLVPVVKDQHDRIVDGHHRSRIAGELGVDFAVQVVTVADEDEAREIARTLNSDRRQLTEEQRRAVVVELRGQGYSYRAIGGALGVSHEQARKDALAESRVNPLTPSQPESVRGVDGKSYPATRPAAAAPEPDAIDDVPLWDEPVAEPTPILPTPDPEQERANAEFRAAVQAGAERQQQELLEVMAKQEAVNAFGRANDGLLDALSYAAAFRPSADVPMERIENFISRAERVLEIAYTWKEQPE